MIIDIISVNPATLQPIGKRFSSFLINHICVSVGPSGFFFSSIVSFTASGDSIPSTNSIRSIVPSSSSSNASINSLILFSSNESLKYFSTVSLNSFPEILLSLLESKSLKLDFIFSSDSLTSFDSSSINVVSSSESSSSSSDSSSSSESSSSSSSSSPSDSSSDSSSSSGSSPSSSSSSSESSSDSSSSSESSASSSSSSSSSESSSSSDLSSPSSDSSSSESPSDSTSSESSEESVSSSASSSSSINAVFNSVRDIIESLSKSNWCMNRSISFLGRTAISASINPILISYPESTPSSL